MKKLAKSLLEKALKSRGYSLVKHNEIHEHSETYWLKRAIDTLDIGVVLDIGANRGQYGERLIKNAGFNGWVHSFEPLPSAYEKLAARAAAHPRWKTHPFAVSKEKGAVDFNIMAGEEFSSIHAPDSAETTLFDNKNTVLDVINVDAIDLSSAIAHARDELPADANLLLKLDVQGHEMSILQGNEAILKGCSAVQIEIAFRTIYDNSVDAEKMISWMKNAGFELGCIFPNNEGHFPNLIEMDAIFVNRLNEV